MSHQRHHTNGRRLHNSTGLHVDDVNRHDLLDLAEHLRQERLFVQHEKNQVLYFSCQKGYQDSVLQHGISTTYITEFHFFAAKGSE